MKLSEVIVELATKLAEYGDCKLSENFMVVLIDGVVTITL